MKICFYKSKNNSKKKKRKLPIVILPLGDLYIFFK